MILTQKEAKDLLQLLDRLGEYREGLNSLSRSYSGDKFSTIYAELVNAHQAITYAGRATAKLLNIDLTDL